MQGICPIRLHADRVRPALNGFMHIVVPIVFAAYQADEEAPGLDVA